MQSNQILNNEFKRAKYFEDSLYTMAEGRKTKREVREEIRNEIRTRGLIPIPDGYIYKPTRHPNQPSPIPIYYLKPQMSPGRFILPSDMNSDYSTSDLALGVADPNPKLSKEPPHETH